MLKIILLVLAVVAFALAAFKVGGIVNWRDAGFALVTASFLV